MDRMDGGQWTPVSRQGYNLRDTVARSTVQVQIYCLKCTYSIIDKL